MKVRITGASPHPQGLMLGLTIEGEKRSWIRFATTVLVVQELTLQERECLYDALNHGRTMADEWLDLPLFE